MTLGTLKLCSSISWYRSGGEAGVEIGHGNTLLYTPHYCCGIRVPVTTTVGFRVSVKDTELMPSQVRQGKRLNVT